MTTDPPTPDAEKIAALEKQVKSLEGALRVAANAIKKDTPPLAEGKPHYAFLLLKEHPYGNRMLEKGAALFQVTPAPQMFRSRKFSAATGCDELPRPGTFRGVRGVWNIKHNEFVSGICYCSATASIGGNGLAEAV